MQNAGSFPSFLVRALLQHRLPLSVLSANKRVSKGSYCAFLQSLVLVKYFVGNYEIWISECQYNKKQHGQLQGTLFLQSFVHKPQPQLAGTQLKAGGTFTNHRLCLISAKEDLQRKLIMIHLGKHPSGLVLASKCISDTYSSTTRRFPRPGLCPRAIPWVSCSLRAQTATQQPPCCMQRQCCPLHLTSAIKTGHDWCSRKWKKTKQNNLKTNS